MYNDNQDDNRVHAHLVITDETGTAGSIPWSRLQGVVDAALIDEEMPPCRLGILVIDDQRSATLHERHFGDPEATDVMTFPDGSEDPEDGRLLLGDIAINSELAARLVARRQADQAPGITDLGEECALYIVHGLLHLLGFDDQVDEDRRDMWARQRALLADMGIGLEAYPD